jgi:hypothetical protein
MALPHGQLLCGLANRRSAFEGVTTPGGTCRLGARETVANLFIRKEERQLSTRKDCTSSVNVGLNRTYGISNGKYSLGGVATKIPASVRLIS